MILRLRDSLQRRLLKPATLTVALLLAAPGTVSAVPSSEGEAAPGTENYLAMELPLIVNITKRRTLHFMQVQVEFKLSSPEVAGQVQQYMIPIRHELVMLLSSKTYNDVTTIRGKQKMRDEALAAVQKILQERTGSSLVENIYFTSIVVQ